MKDIIIYHGSTQIVEYPEEDGQRDLQERVLSTSICTDQMKN